MRVYMDRHGVQHTVEVSLATRRVIKERHGVDLLLCATDPMQLQEFVSRLSDDDRFLLEALAIAEHSNADAIEQVLDGTSLQEAANAFVQAVIDFFPDASPLKAPLRAMLAKTEAHVALVMQTTQDVMLRGVEEMDFRTELSASPNQTNGSGASPQSAAWMGTAASA